MRRPAALLLAAVVLAACSRAPADPVDVLLAEMEAAAEARDAHRLGERLSPGFRSASGLDRPEAIAELGRTFAAYESVALEVHGVEAERDGATARVRCVVEFSGRARKAFGLEGLLPPSAAYRFDLAVADEGGTWRVREATWEGVEPAEAGR
jgi:hypothetical protein